MTNITATLLDHMGDDLTPASAAWVSTGKSRDDKTTDEAIALIERLGRDGHDSCFEHLTATFSVEAPIYIMRHIQRHRLGCLSGDSVITMVDKNRKFIRYKTIKDIYEHKYFGVPDRQSSVKNAHIDYGPKIKRWKVWKSESVNGQNKYIDLGLYDNKSEAEKVCADNSHITYRRRKLESVQNPYLMSINEKTGSTIANRMIDVFYSGKKEVYEILTDTGLKLKATADHRFRTCGEYKRLGELSPGDYVDVSGRIFPEGRDPYVSRHLRVGIGHWTARVRKDLIPADGATCNVCKCHFPIESLDVDHIVPVVSDLSKALSVSNLQILCKSCHRAKTNDEQKLAYRKGCYHGAVQAKIVSITIIGVEDTYDIEMEAPNHNFMANGFVVHNSFNELSGRYKSMGNATCYVPELAMEESQKAIMEHFERSLALYKELRAMGEPKEIARVVLPLNTMTRIRWTGNLRYFANFIRLRITNEAQYEVRQVAEQVLAALSGIWPVSVKAIMKGKI